MNGSLPAPLTILLKFNLPLNRFLVLAGGIVRVLARCTSKANEFVVKFTLSHNG